MQGKQEAHAHTRRFSPIRRKKEFPLKHAILNFPASLAQPRAFNGFRRYYSSPLGMVRRACDRVERIAL